jgi:hypothetical protein
MGFVEEMKWWHWFAISVVLGVLLAYINASNSDLPAVHASMDTTDFERNLIKAPLGPNGLPWITNVTVYPPTAMRAGDGTTIRQMVTFRCLVAPLGGDVEDQWFTMLAPVPYEASPRWAVGAYGNRAYPGVKLYLARFHDTIESVTAAEYGKDTPEGENAIINANELLRTAPTRALVRFRPAFFYFIPWNPAANKTVTDLLDEAAADGIHVGYRRAWWEAPRYVYEIWIGGSVLLIGVIWPAILRTMQKGGLGRVTAPSYLARKEKTGKPWKAGKPGKPEPEKKKVGITEEDLEQVKNMSKNLEESLRASGALTPTAVAPAVPTGTAPAAAGVKKLTGGAMESGGGGQDESKPKEFTGGEFYPVEVPKGKDEKPE